MRPRHPLLTAACALAVIGALVHALAGRFTLVTTRGVSMEPTYRAGDLVLTRSAGSYQVGDIIGFRSEKLGDEIILHRVVDIDGGRFTTKGDNNSWLDPDRPTEEAIVGKAWIHVPRIGGVIGRLGPARTPVLFGLAGLFVALGSAKRSGRRRRGGGTKEESAMRQSARATIAGLAGARMAVAATAAVLALASVAAYARPVTTSRTREITYEHDVAFSYGAKVAASTVYPDGRIDTGDPIFRRLVGVLDVAADYELRSDSTHAVRGTIGLVAEVRIDGWSQRFALAGASPISGGQGRVEGQIRFDELDHTVAEVAALAGVHGGTYDVEVRPTIDLGGTVDGAPIDDARAPAFVLSVTDARVHAPSELTTSASEQVAVDDAVPATVSFGPVEARVSQARRVVVPATAGAMLLLGFLMVVSWRVPRDEAARIRAANRARVVPIDGIASGTTIIDVTNAAALKRVADDYDRLILHAREVGEDWFLVQDGQMMFRYRVPQRRAWAVSARTSDARPSWAATTDSPPTA
jgi:signal peptidase I